MGHRVYLFKQMSTFMPPPPPHDPLENEKSLFLKILSVCKQNITFKSIGLKLISGESELLKKCH